MIENLTILFDAAVQFGQNVILYGAVPAGGGIGGLYLLYKAGNWIKRF